MTFEELDKIQKDRNIAIENLPDSFRMPDKEILSGINQLFEMIQLNNELIKAMEKRIKLLEIKSKQFIGTTSGCDSKALLSLKQSELIPGQLYRFLEPLRVQLQLTWDQKGNNYEKFKKTNCRTSKTKYTAGGSFS